MRDYHRERKDMMFGFVKRSVMDMRMSPALKTRRLRRGMDYFRYILIGELRMIGGKNIRGMEKTLMHNEKSDLVEALSYAYADYTQEFNKVARLYPHILGELLSIFEEAEDYSNMLERTSMLIPTQNRYNQEHWVQYFNHQRARLGALYDSYPREITNIFYYFGNTDRYMSEASVEVRYRGQFDKIIMLISRPGNRQLAFIEEVSYFLSFCQLINKNRI